MRRRPSGLRAATLCAMLAAVFPAAAATQSSSGANGPSRWSVTELLDMDVHNDAGPVIGRVEDLVIGPKGTVRAIDVSVGGFLGIGDHTARIPFGEFVFVADLAAAEAAAGGHPADQPDTTPGGTRRVIGTDQALSNATALVERDSESWRVALSADPKPDGSATGPDMPTVEDRNRRAAARADDAFADAAGFDHRSLPLAPPGT